MADLPTRRAVLRGTVALPALVAAMVPAVASADTAAWAAALARYDRAEAAFNADVKANGDAEARYFALRGGVEYPVRRQNSETFESVTARRIASAAEDKRWQAEAGLTASETRLRATSAAHDKALDALLATLAPDMAAVIRKLELVRDWSKDEPGLPHVLSDLRRLAGEGR